LTNALIAQTQAQASTIAQVAQINKPRSLLQQIFG
jgi:hypothetical protein